MNILVIDVGSSGMRGLLLTETGNELTQSGRTYKMTYGENGTAEQNPSEWEQSLYAILAEISAAAAKNAWSIDALTLTSQRSSLICMDENFHPLRPAIMWEDKRTNAICERLSEYNDRIFCLCGATVNPVFSAAKMTWVHEQESDIYNKTYKFMGVADFLIHLMTGAVLTDRTYGSRTMLMNLKSGEWDEELLQIFNVDKEKLCELIEPGSICGYTTEHLHSVTGIPSGIPVITAGGDQQCSSVGQGVTHEGVLSINAGTGGFLIASSNHIPKCQKADIICNRACLAGQYIIESSLLTCCSAFDWFVDNFYDGKRDYERIDKDIEASPAGAGGLICLPYFQGRSTPDWNNNAKAGFLNITLNTSRGDMLRSLLEGICYEIANETDIIKQYVDLKEIYINGGLTNSAPFDRILSSVLGQELIRRGGTDSTAAGALIAATTSLGIYKTADEAFSIIAPQDKNHICRPAEELTAFYSECRVKMNEAYTKLYAS